MSETWIDAGAAESILPEDVVPFEHEGHSYALYRTADDRYFATDGLCTHEQVELADGFVIFPGGLGTLDEAVEIITWKQLSLHDKPIVLLDLDGYWGMFLKLIEDAVAMGFAKPAVKGLFTVVKTVDEILPALSQGPRDRVRPAPSRI